MSLASFLIVEFVLFFFSFESLLASLLSSCFEWVASLIYFLLGSRLVVSSISVKCCVFCRLVFRVCKVESCFWVVWVAEFLCLCRVKPCFITESVLFLPSSWLCVRVLCFFSFEFAAYSVLNNYLAWSWVIVRVCIRVLVWSFSRSSE